MSANVETMFYTREKPWHGLGTCVEEAPSAREAIELAGLNWDVIPAPIFDSRGIQIRGYVANTRNSDNSVLGIVGERYSIVQNAEAFDFTDSLLGEGLKYETAGSLRGGRQIWLLGKMPERVIAGDKFEPYICFTNTHDGTGAIRCCMTPVRVVCNNTLNMALAGAKRTWSARHTGDIQSKLDDARRTLDLADAYLNTLALEAEILANETITPSEQGDIIKALVPMPKDATDRQKRVVEEARTDIVCCILRPDLAQFLNTKWGFLNAVADYVDHGDPMRKTKNWKENRFNAIVTGHPMLDKAMNLMGVSK